MTTTLNAVETKTVKTVRPIALTSHDVNLLRSDTPVESVQVKGRAAVIFKGEALEDYILVRIPQSGMPVPQVKDVSASATETLNIKGAEVEIEVSSSGSKIIFDLPEPQEGVIYITSSLTANEAMSQGREDVYAPRQIVCVLNNDGSTTIVGTLGLKKGG